MEIKIWMIIAALVYVVWTIVAYKKFKETDDLFDTVVLSWIIYHVLMLGVLVWATLDQILIYLDKNPDMNLFQFTIFKF